MKRLLLSVLVAVAAIGANAQFKGSVDIKPIQNAKPRQISFNFAAVCKQLEVDRKEFATILQRGWYRHHQQPYACCWVEAAQSVGAVRYVRQCVRVLP